MLAGVREGLAELRWLLTVSFEEWVGLVACLGMSPLIMTVLNGHHSIVPLIMILSEDC